MKQCQVNMKDYEALTQRVFQKKEELDVETVQLSSALIDYSNMTKNAFLYASGNVDELKEQKKVFDKNNLEILLNPQMLADMKECTNQATLKVLLQGKTKIWKPNKFVPSRRTKIAENVEDVLGGKR